MIEAWRNCADDLRIAIRIAAIVLCGLSSVAAQEWHSWGGDPGGSRFSPLTQINRSNIRTLRCVWVYHTGEVKSGELNLNPSRVEPFESTPLVVDGVMYFSTPSSRVIALDAETGHELWQFDPQAGRPGRTFHAHRGVAWWQSADARDRRILVGTFETGIQSRLIALDARTGKPKTDFGDNGSVDLRAGTADQWRGTIYAVTSPPAIYKNLVIVGAEVPEYPSQGPSGEVRAFDVRSGKLVWTFHPVPRSAEMTRAGWEQGVTQNRTGGNVWSVMSLDAERGIVFLPVGSASYDFYGADRTGPDLYANSLVALDAATGKLLWHYQMVHHDIWDYDIPAQPALVTIRREGRDIPAVAQVTKMGFVFVLDRRTGKPLFPVEERPVPQSTVPGEATSPTQPFPLRPPALSRQSMTAADLTTATPPSHSYCAALYSSMKHGGIYTPYGTAMTLVTPGELGGGNWSGGSFDPSTGRFFVNTNNLFAMGYLEAQPAGSPERYRRNGIKGEHDFFWDSNQLPCQRPPWGLLTAVDLNTGTVAWKTPLGHVEGLPGNSGSLNIGGSIVTAGGLVFIGATVDGQFRAFDSSLGKELWSVRLDAAAHATPMTYLGKKTGRQYVVIAAGGGGFFRGKVSDTLVAYALPD